MSGKQNLSLTLAAVVLALFAVGCKRTTGLLVEVKGPDGTSSTEAGITKLDFVVAHPSWCERFVGVAPAMHTTVDVTGRDLTAKPYEFFIEPSHQTDLDEPVYVAALAYAADGRLLGEASFDAHPLAKGEVPKRSAGIFLFTRAAQAGGPRYVTDDGCVCTPGEPWVGTGTGSTCDPLVITSFDRLVDTAGCELTPKGAPLPVPVCDGQQYPDEPTDRNLPCWAADDQGVCRMTVRRCADHGGVAYADECTTDATDTMLPADSMLCARYLACEQKPCTDVIGCMRSGFAQTASIKCTLRVDPTSLPGEPIRPCPGGAWTTTLPTGATAGGACLAAMLDGTQQPPFKLGFVDPMATGVRTLDPSCPNEFAVEAIDAPYPDAVPSTKELDIVSGEHLVHVTITVERQCTGEPSLVCSP